MNICNIMQNENHYQLLKEIPQKVYDKRELEGVERLKNLRTWSQTITSRKQYHHIIAKVRKKKYFTV